MDEKNKRDEMHDPEWIQENVEDLYENAPCGYFTTLPDGTVVKINKTLLDWLNYEREEVLGEKRIQNLFSVGGRIFYETHHAPLLTMQGFINELNYDMVRKDGSKLPVLINAVLKKDEEGNPWLQRCTVFDYTDRKKYERELLLEKKRAEAAVEAKSLFLSTISHEIRTPIHAILSTSDLLHRNNKQPELEALIDLLQYSSQNLLKLVNDLLDLSKMEMGKIQLIEQPFQLHELIQNLSSHTQIYSQQKGLTLEVVVGQDVPRYLVGDHIKIGQILTNLLHNAIKFTENGTVNLVVQAKDVRINSVELLFAVEDTGIGIRPENLAKVFEAFTQEDYTASKKHEGSGLGLAICKHLVELHSSELLVESEFGKGSRFYFTLVLKRDRTRALAPSVPSPKMAKGSLKDVRLLLVEDNESNIFIAKKYFDDWNVMYDVAKDGSKAVSLVQQNNYDLVLMDLKMPVMDGYETSSKIRQLPGSQFQQIPIIAFSASYSTVLSTKMKAAGINGFLSKPFKPEQLFEIIKKKGAATGYGSSDKSQQSNAQIQLTPLTKPLQLTKIREIFEDDQPAIRDFLKTMLSDLILVQREIKNALNNRNLRHFKDAAHKVHTINNLLEVEKFKQLLLQGKEVLNSNQQHGLEEKSAQILREMDGIISALEKVVEDNTSDTMH